jgi:hypothetical protein
VVAVRPNLQDHHLSTYNPNLYETSILSSEGLLMNLAVSFLIGAVVLTIEFLPDEGAVLCRYGPQNFSK